MRTNLWSAFTLTMIITIVVGIGYNNEAGATPPKENKTVVKTVKNKPEKAKPSTQQMTAMSQILKSNTDSMSSKLAIKMAGSGTEFVMGGKGKGMGFRGTGGGGGRDNGFARTHGLNKLEKPSKAKPVKGSKKKTVKAQQALPCSQTIQVYEEPAMTPLQ